MDKLVSKGYERRAILIALWWDASRMGAQILPV